MPTATIPLAFAPDQRGPIITSSSAPTKDARMVRCFTTVFPNPVTGTKEAFVEKIPGFASSSTPGGSDSGTAIYQSANFTGPITAFGSTSTIRSASTSMGTVDGGAVYAFTEAVLSGTATLLFRTTDGAGYFLASDAMSGLTFTANFSSGSSTVTNVSSFAGLYEGQKLSTVGSQVPANTRIGALNSGASELTMTNNAGANGTGTTVTREGIARIIDASFSNGGSGAMVELDGYVFLAAKPDTSLPAVIIQSDINDAAEWDSANRITPHIYDMPSGLVLYRDMVVYGGSSSIQFFRNTGNPSGSVLSQVDELSVEGVGVVGAAATAVCPFITLAGSIYWIALVNGVIDGIYRMNGFTPEKISNAAVTRALSAVVAPIASTTIIAFDGFSMFGHHWLYVGVGDIGYLYCVETNKWTEAGFFSGGMRICGSSSTTANPAIIGLRLTGGTGKVYVMDKTNLTYQDDSAAYTMTIQTPELVLNDGQPFSVHEVELIGDTQSSGLSTLSSCDDDYTTFTVRGAFDMTKQRKVVNRCGHYKNHVAFKIEHSANTAFRAQALKIHWSPAVGRGFR